MQRKLHVLDVGGKQIMDSIYLVVAGVIAITLTLGFAYAERSTIEVPFDYHGLNCTFDQEVVTYVCIWQGSSETITKKGIQDAGEVPPIQLREESKAAHDLAIEDRVEVELTEAERLIEQLEEKIDAGRANDADTELYRLLKEVQEKCYFGIEEGRLIQQFQSFDLPDTIVDSNPQTNLSYRTNAALGKIVKLLEACRAWEEYKPQFLGPEYINKIDDDSTSQVYHGDVPTQSAYNTHELTPEDYANANQKAKDQICSHSFYSSQYKRDAGCFADIEELDGKGIQVNTEAYRAYLLYKATDYVDINTLKKAEVDKAQTQSLEQFALQHGIDIADLKNLVQNVDEYNEAQKP